MHPHSRSPSLPSKVPSVLSWLCAAIWDGRESAFFFLVDPMNASPARWCTESVTCFPRCRQGCTHRICPAGVWLTGHRPCAKHFPKHLPRALTDPQWRPPGHCGAFLSGRPGAAKIGDHSCPFYWEGNDGAKCREGLGIEHRNVPLPSLHARDPNSSSPGPAASRGACGRKHAICMFQGHTLAMPAGSCPQPRFSQMHGQGQTRSWRLG